MTAAVDLLHLGGKRRTPYIAQSEGSECALACIAMVASFHGYETDMIALRQRYGMSLKGANLKQVIQVAEDIGFNARPLRGEIEDLPHLSLPAILHWNLNHFVVLTRISAGIRSTRYHIHDPARGALLLSRDEISRHFTGVALDLLKSESFKPKIDRRDLRIGQLWSSMSGFWQTIRQVVLLSLVLQFVVLVSPFFLQISVDTVFPSFDYDLLLMLALGFGGLTIINFLASWLRSLILVTLSNSLSYQVVVNLFRHLVRLPLDWFEKRHVGDIVSRFGSTQPISHLLSQGMIAAFIDGVMALMTLTLMFVYSGILGGVAVAALAIYIVVRLAFLQALRLRNLDVITTAANENSSFIETVRGIAAIKAFGQEGNRQRLWQKKKADAVNAQIKLGRLTAGFDAIGQLVLALEKVLFVYLAIRLALDAKLSVGMIFAFQAYKDQFLNAGMKLVEQALNYKVIQVHLTRISDIALSQQENQNENLNVKRYSLPNNIDVRNIRFQYGIGEPEVLRGISLSVKMGESIAIVGPSGGGKTTLMKVMMGLVEPTFGDVIIGGQPISRFDRQTLRQTFGSVCQDDTLFAGTIAENISFFDPDMNLERVVECADIAQIRAGIESMPMSFESLIGDMGSALSGGQRQRVLLARAIYNKPSVLFIDEGTSNLDPDTEQIITNNILNLNITTIFISHRPRIAQHVDRVFEVIDGRARELAILR